MGRPRRLTLLALAVFFARCERAPDHERVQWIMGTYARVVLPENHAGAADRVFERWREIDSILSIYSPTSAISAVNQAAGPAPVPVPDDVARAVRFALQAARETGGRFDPTVGSASSDAPPPGHLDVAVVDRTIVLRRRGLHLDLGGMGKGFAVDEAAEILNRSGVPAYLIALGGDYRVRGRPWKVHVQDPRHEAPIAWFRTTREETCISTSGDYRRGEYVDGRWVHHILNPPGVESTGGFSSLTLLGPPPCALVDAYATGLFVMGAGEAREFIAGKPELEILGLEGSGRVSLVYSRRVEFHM